ncbi:hypothetical protein PanWU01x14_081100 [Parasponia andersonii]|uniref:RNase H type-1 domain-containing protein n=1 Tax=Parasponia andersonii TaxID=3476 RepID=A0A2P5DAX6_PARAD|nr:hypothetical protein PanWU01x14_081100 [Parasponia andersonii]
MDSGSAPWIKVNVDVVVREIYLVVAVVARDEFGNILALQVEVVQCTDPTFEEASTILLRINMVVMHSWKFVVIESHYLDLNGIRIYRKRYPGMLI